MFLTSSSVSSDKDSDEQLSSPELAEFIWNVGQLGRRIGTMSGALCSLCRAVFKSVKFTRNQGALPPFFGSVDTPSFLTDIMISFPLFNIYLLILWIFLYPLFSD